MNLLIPNPRDIPGFVKELAKYRINIFPAVNTLFNALLNNPDFAKLDFSGCRVCNGGGMAVQQAVAEKWLKVTGCPIIEGYGLSETSPVATANRCDIREFTGTIGLPMPSTEIDDPRRRRQAGAARRARRNRHPRPAGDGRLLEPAGRNRQGHDAGRLLQDRRHRRHGRARLHHDRRPQEGHDPGLGLQRLPERDRRGGGGASGRARMRRVGVPDENSGEAVKLFVVRKDPALTEEQLMDYCKEQLTGYKRPKYIEFRDELPKTNVGKILRRELRDTAAGLGTPP